MRSPAVIRPVRLFLAAALLVSLASCGSSDDGTRQRNAALECDVMTDGTLPEGCDPAPNGGENRVECDAQWDPTTSVVTLCDNFAKVVVTQKGDKGKALNAGDVAEADAGVNAVKVDLLDGAETLEISVWTRNPAGEVRKAGQVEFETDKTESKSFMYTRDSGNGSGETDVDNELVFGFEQHDVEQTVDTTAAGINPFGKKTTAELKVEYRLNGVAPESNILSATLTAYDSAGALLSTTTKSVDATKGGTGDSDEWSELETTLKGDFMESTETIKITVTGRDGAANSGGQTGPRVTSVELKVGDSTINANPGFDDLTASWSVTGASFSECSTVNGARPCVTNAPFESAFSAGTPDVTTTVPDGPGTPDETTTTVDETTTTLDETTTTVGETTTTVDETTTTVGENQVTTQTLAPPLLVPRVDCSFAWNAESRTFVACEEFRAIKVAVYGADGRYVGSASSENGNSVEITTELAASMRYVYYSLGGDLPTAKGSLVMSRAREWMTIVDATQDVSDSFLMDPTNNPTLREDGSPETMYLSPTVVNAGAEVEWSTDEGFSVNQMVIEVNGRADLNSVTVPLEDSYSIRVYASNEFGFLDYVAGGTTASTSQSVSISAQVQVSGGLGILQVNSESDSVGIVNPENFVEGNIDDCVGAQPILYTNPNSPSRSNRVTISLDSDCSSVNGILAVAVVRNDFLDYDGDFELSVAWWNVSSTRYSSRMTETIYLPDGKYSIYFFNPDTFFIKGIDYQVDSGGSNNLCTEMSLRIDTDKGLGIVEGCDALASIDATAVPMAPGLSDSTDESQQIEPDIETTGSSIELATVPDGWWHVAVFDRQQSVMGGLFALCVRSCETPESGSVTTDTSALASAGTVTVEDPECLALQNRAEAINNPVLDQGMVAYLQADNDHAPRAAWLDLDMLDEDESLTGRFTARFSRPGVRAYLATNCVASGAPKSEGDPDYYVSSGLAVVDVSSAPTIVSANDTIEDAVDITGASEVTLQQLGATLESDEPLAGLSSFLFDRSLITTTWLKFTAPTTSRVKLTVPVSEQSGFEPVTSGITVYRKNSSGQLGFVTTNMSIAQLIWMEAMSSISEVEDSLTEATAQEVNVQAGATYYVQVVGVSMLRHPEKLLVTSVDQEAWSTADIADMANTTVPGDETPDVTTTPGEPTESPSTSENVTNTVSPSTTEEPSTTSTDAPSGPETTTGPAAPDTSASPQTTAGEGDSPTTTVAPSTNQKVAEGMLDLIQNGSRNETLPVLAGDGVPTVEAREDALSVTIAMSDLVASVSKSGAAVDPRSRIIVKTKTGRRIAVSQKVKSITVPVVGVFGNEDLKVTAYSTDGKELTSNIVVKKTIAPLVKVETPGNKMSSRIIALAALLLLVIVIFFISRYARRSGAAA
ncbi:MAG: hypothetical protein RJA47_1713 [Actinomycetota bacterium]